MCVCFGRELRNVHGRSVFECECENTAAKYDFIGHYEVKIFFEVNNGIYYSISFGAFSQEISDVSENAIQSLTEKLLVLDRRVANQERDIQGLKVIKNSLFNNFRSYLFRIIIYSVDSR